MATNSDDPPGESKVRHLRSGKLRRIIIVGTSGSGKSTLAREAAERLRLPFVASDDFWWESDWRPAPDDAVRARVLEIAGRDEWVLESNFDASRRRWSRSVCRTQH